MITLVLPLDEVFTSAATDGCPQNIGALIVRIGLRGPLYYTYNKEVP